MLDTAFYLVLNMSITAILIGLFLVLLRFIKKIPRLVIYALWSLVFIRLVLPFTFSSDISILNFARKLIKKVVVVPLPANEYVKLTMSNMVGTAKSYFPVTYRTSFLEIVFRASALVWIVGAVLLVLIVIVLYYFTNREVYGAILLKDNIYTSNMVFSPIVYGIFRPKIIIPVSLKQNEAELKYVLLHEKVHIRRHDNLYRFAAILTACLHWFNPFIWIYLRLFLKDMELACDIKAVSLLSKDERKKYMKTLLNFSVGQKVFLTSPFGNKNTKARVLNILSYKKLTNIAVVFSVLFLFTVAVILLTNPIK